MGSGPEVWVWCVTYGLGHEFELSHVSKVGINVEKGKGVDHCSTELQIMRHFSGISRLYKKNFVDPL